MGKIRIVKKEEKEAVAGAKTPEAVKSGKKKFVRNMVC